MAYFLGRTLRLVLPPVLAIGCADVEVKDHHEALDGGGDARGVDSTPKATQAEMEAACIRFGRAQEARYDECFGPAIGGNVVSLAARCPDRLFAPGSSLTVDGVLRCSDELATFPCEELTTGRRVPDCFTAGTRKAGEPCISDWQCESERCSAGYPGCGVCKALVERDAPCDSSLDSCTGGQYCVDGRCVDPEDSPYQPLEDGEPCGPGSGACRGFCKTPPDSASGVCVPYPAVGERCKEGDEFMPCQDGYCPKEGDRCLPVPAVGEPCGVGPLNTASCPEGSRCVNRVCAPYGKVGDPCEPKDYEGQCEGIAECGCAGDDCSRYVCNEIRFMTERCDEPLTVCNGGSSCVDGVCQSNRSGSLFDEFCGAGK